MSKKDKQTVASLPQEKIVLSSWCLARDFYAGSFSLFDLPERAAAAGYTQVEANDFMLPPPRFSRVVQPLMRLIPTVNHELWRYRKESLVEFKSRLDKFGVTCVGWTMNTDFTTGTLGSLSRRFYRDWGFLAVDILKVPILRIIPGGHRHQKISDRIVREMADFVSAALGSFPHLQQVVLENHWGIGTQISKHVALFEEARKRLSPTIQSQFSICADPTNLEKDQPEKDWATMAPYSGHIHLKSIRFNEPQAVELTLEKYIETMNAGNPQYDGYFVLEDAELTDFYQS